MNASTLVKSGICVGLIAVAGACGAAGSGERARAATSAAGVGARPSATAAAHVPRHPLAATAPKRPVAREYFGVRVVDDYEWLEDGKNAEVRAFVSAQTSHARAQLDGAPDRAAIRARVGQVLAESPEQRTNDWRELREQGGLLFARKHAPPKQQPLLVVLNADADPKSERVVCDPNTIDPSGKTSIDFFVPSPDKRLALVSLSKDGSESGDVHVFDVATGKDKGETIARVNGGTAGGSVAWNADGTSFWYTRYPRAGERAEQDLDFYQQVYFHKLGTSEDKDTYSIGKEFPRIAEVELGRSDDGKSILAKVANGDGGEVEFHVQSGGKWTRLSRFEDELAAATFAPDGKVYAVARKGSPRGKVIAFAAPFDGEPSAVLPQGEGVIDDIVVTKSALYTVEIARGPSKVRRIPLGGRAEPLAREPKKEPPPKKGSKPAPPKPPEKPEPPVTIEPGARGPVAAELPLPPVSSVTSAIRIGEDLLLRVESYLEAPAWFRYRASEHRLVKTALAKKAPYETTDLEVVRETCTSKDGTKVPMSILRKKGIKLDGAAPTLLTAYGGFGVAVKPRMRASHRVWLDQGGVVAEANLRGGGELGEEWHRAGNLTRKQNVFDDFYACARALGDLGYTSPAHLAISGRSNGGLLMGAALTQHPEMYRAVATAVGLYDMLRSELSPNGAFNVTEYGSVKDEAQFHAMRAYSPVHNVRDGVAYPAVLFMTGANDPRVDPYHSRKMVARLQAATSSDRPLMLLASDETGHGGATPLATEIEETTDMLTFLFRELGVRFRAPGANPPQP